jgi:hypothetical protein
MSTAAQYIQMINCQDLRIGDLLFAPVVDALEFAFCVLLLEAI